MSAFKRGLSMFLAVLLLFGTIPAAALAASEPVSIENEFIKVTVNPENGRFGVQTLEGQPQRKRDQNTFLTYLRDLIGLDDGVGDADTSFTTFRINGTDYIFGNRYDFKVGEKTLTSTTGTTTAITEGYGIPEGCQAIVTPWSIEGVTITQLLLMYPDTVEEGTGKRDKNTGNVQLYYQIENESGADVEIGARILLDTMVGANDGPEFQIGTVSENTLKVERMLSPDPEKDQGISAENTNYWSMPNYWVMKDTLDPSNPMATNVIAYGYTELEGMQKLDYMIVSHWNKLANEKFEEFDDYVAIPAEQTEAAAEVARTQRLVELSTALAEQKKTEWDLKAKAAEGMEPGTKAQLDAEKAKADYDKVEAARVKAVAAYEDAKKALESMGRTQVGSSIIDPNLDFTDDQNAYGSADSAVALFWKPFTVAASGKTSLGTIYGLGEIIDPTSVLAISFPNPVTQVEINPNDQNSYKNDGLFDITVEVENLVAYDMEHDYIDVEMTLEKGLRFVKMDEYGKVLRGEDGVPLTSYSSTQTVRFEKARTTEQAAKGEPNPIKPGEKLAVTFKVMAQGKPWPTTRQYMVTASSPQLAEEFTKNYGDSSGEDIKALYNASRANFVFLPSVGSGTPTYSTSVSPEECFTVDPKYITVNLTNIEAYNPGSSVRGQEANPNFNLYFEEIATGARYQVDVLDNVQCVITDDGLTGDMRISYTNGTLVDADGIVLEADLGPELPVGEYRVAIDYISVDEEENATLDTVSEQTFLVTTNEVARIREPGVLAVVKETVDFDDGNLMQKIDELVAEVQAAIEELEKISEKLSGTDWSDAVYEEVVDFAKELISPVTKIYDSMEQLADFSNIESEMRELSKSYDELADVDFSSLKNFDVGKAMKGVNVDVSLSDEFKKMFSVEELLLGPLGLSGLADMAEGGVDGIYDSIKQYGSSIIDPIYKIYEDMASLGDLDNLSEAEFKKLQASFSELEDVNFEELKGLNLQLESVELDEDALFEQFSKIIGFDITKNPFEDGVDGIYDSLLSYGEDAIKPIMNLYDDIAELADFSDIEKEWDELVKVYPELEDVDMSCLEDFDFVEALTGVANSAEVDVALTEKFKELFDYETILAGPFAGSGDKTAEEVFYDRISAYGKKLISPITGIYDELEGLTDFSNIEAEMEELAKLYPELEGVDFSCLDDFDIAELIDGIDVNVSLTDKFKELYDYEAILAGPFASEDKTMEEVFEERITNYALKTLSPIISIYEDIEGLANFDNIVADMERLATEANGLDELDFSCLADFDVEEAIADLWNATSVDVDLSDEFKKTFGTVFSGPKSYDGDGLSEWLSAVMDAKEAGEAIYKLGLKAYNGELSIQSGAEEVLALYKTYVNTNISVDWDNAISKANKDAAAQTLDQGEKLALAFMAMYAKMQDIYGGLEQKYNKATEIYDDIIGIKDKVVDVVSKLADGDLSALLDGGKDLLTFVLGEWLNPVYNAYESTKTLYEIGQRAYAGDLSVREGAQMMVDFCEQYLDLSISVDPGTTNIEAGKKLYNNSEKLVLAFMAMYARMQNIYSDIGDRYRKAGDIYNQVIGIKDDIVDFVEAICEGDFSELLSLGTDMLEFVIGEWLEPVKTAVNSAKDVYEIGKRAYEGKLSVQEGARLLMDFYEDYLDVSVKVDWTAVGDTNIAAAEETAKQAKQMAVAFMVMYARMENIYASIEKKVDRATDVYNQAKSIVNTVIDLVGALADGDFSGLLDMGTDIISSVIDAWKAQAEEGINSVKEIYEIAEHAYRGDLSIEEGAQLLIDFYETYLNVTVSATLDMDNTEEEDRRIVGAAFMVMYAQLKNIYTDVRTGVETAQKVYNQVTTIVNTVIKLVEDPMAAVNDLVNMGEDAIFNVLNAYLDKINEMIDSVKAIYDIGKRAYEGDLDVKEGAELLIGFYEKYLNVSISADLDAIGEENVNAAKDTYNNGKKMALAFMAMYARMKNIFSNMNAKYEELMGIYDDMMEVVDTVVKLFTDPASGAYALMDMIKARIMDKLDGLGMYKDMFMQVLDVVENFDQIDPDALLDEAMNFAVTTARVKADQALYSEIYGVLLTAATALDPNSDYDWDPSELKTSLPTYRLMAFEDEAALEEYEEKIAEENAIKKAAVSDEKEKAKVGNDGVMVKITGMIRQTGEGENVTDYIVDTSSEPAIINDTVAYKGGDLVFTQGKLKISLGDFTLDAGEYISEAQSLYGSETPLFDTLVVSGTGDLYIAGSGFVFHQGEWSLDFYNGFDKILNPVEVEEEEETNDNAESDALNETAAWAIGALNDLFNPLKALSITDVYFNRHTLFSAPNFSVAGFGLKFDNYLLRSSEVCFGGHIDFKIVTGEIQDVFFNSSGLQAIKADLKFGLPQSLGLLDKDESVDGNLFIHYYDPDYVAYVRANYNSEYAPEEKYGLDFSAKLKNVGGVAVALSFKRVADGRILPDLIGFEAQPPAPGILVYAGVYLTELRGAIKELADTIAGGSSTVPLTIEAGVDINFGVSPATFEGAIDMVLKMTGIEFNGSLKYKGKPMIPNAQIKAQWVTPWFLSASMDMDVMGMHVIVGTARIFIGQNLEKNRIDFEGFVSAALQIPDSIPVVGGVKLGQVSFGLNNDKIWGSCSVGIKPIYVSVGITYYWGGGIEFGTCGENLPEAYNYLLLERPEEEPVLIAIGSGMRTEATSWVNENTIHEIEFHAVEEGVSILDNGQNEIGIGGIEVLDDGRTHVIPVGSVDADRDALIEIEYYGEDLPELQLTDDDGAAYDIQIADAADSMEDGDNAFRQELVTTDGINRHLVYVMVPRTALAMEEDTTLTLTAGERVQTKLLSTPIAPAIDDVDLSGSDTDYTANITVSNAHAGDTVSLFLTKETVGTATEYITTEDGTELPITEANDPGVAIFTDIPVENGTVTQAIDLTDICGYGTGDEKTNEYAVDGLKDVRELLESGDYYLRAVLKSDTAYDAMTSANSITLTDPKAPAATEDVILTNAGNGYFDLGFAVSEDATSYRVDFYDADGNLNYQTEDGCNAQYNGLIFEAADLTEYETEDGYTVRIGGLTVTGGEGTEDDPYTYSGLVPGKEYVAKVYAAKQTEDGNYHYAKAAESEATELPASAYVGITAITAEQGTMGIKQEQMDDLQGGVVYTTARTLTTNASQPTLKLVTTHNALITAYNGDTAVSETISATKGEEVAVPLTGLTTDGDYAVELQLTNAATNDVSVSVVYVTIDTQRPTLFVTSPSVSKSVNFNSITLTGVTEPGSTLKANGNAVKVAADGTYQGTVTLNKNLAAGEIVLEVTDKAGNTNKAIVPVANSAYQAPIGINVVRTGTMKTGTTQAAQVYLKYANGKTADGTQKYKSVALSSAEKENVTYEVVRGDAVEVTDNGRIKAVQEGASLLNVSYAVNDTLTLETTMAVSVDDDSNKSTLIGGDTTSGGGGGGGTVAAVTETTTDVVVNGKTETATTDENGTSTVQVTEETNVDTTKTLTVENLSTEADKYVLKVDASVAKELSGENGEGVSFTGGATQVSLPGKVLTGSPLQIVLSNPTVTETARSNKAAQTLGATVATGGSSIALSGTNVNPGDRVQTQLELPAGIDTGSITAMVYVDENGTYTNLPWKLDVAGSTAYVRCYLPGSGTLVPMSSKATFSDVSPDYWGAAAIEAAAGQMLIRGYLDGTFKPTADVVRSEFATIMLRAGGLLTAPKAEISYADVSSSDWCYDYIRISNGLGLTQGSDGYFRPNSNVTRAEAMVMASRLLKLMGLAEDVSDAEADEILSVFTDAQDVPFWAKKEIAICVKSGIINGINGAIMPSNTLTRMEAALIATRISNVIANTL